MVLQVFELKFICDQNYTFLSVPLADFNWRCSARWAKQLK